MEVTSYAAMIRCSARSSADGRRPEYSEIFAPFMLIPLFWQSKNFIHRNDLGRNSGNKGQSSASPQSLGKAAASSHTPNGWHDIGPHDRLFRHNSTRLSRK